MFANARRGLRIVGTDFAYLSEGAYGLVFVNASRTRVLKVFRRKDDEAHCREVYAAETEALVRGNSLDDVRSLVPCYFGPRTDVVVTEDGGKDVSDEFFADLNYEMEYVEGHFQKIGSIDRKASDPVRALFRSVGIAHTVDASVILDTEGKVTKVIDFAMREIEAWA